MEVVSTELGVRSAVLHATNRHSPLRFTLYAMVHLGEARFYAEVSQRLRDHDLIVAEGILGKDRRGGALTQVYQLAARSERLGLVVQPQDMFEVGVPVVWPDMTATEFGDRWESLPWHERAIATAGGPLGGMFLRAFGTREMIARHLQVNDDTDIENWRPENGLEKLIRSDRDALLIKALTKIHEERRHETIDVAVVYGADHVLPVVTYLMAALKYVVTDSEWLTVFDY